MILSLAPCSSSKADLYSLRALAILTSGMTLAAAVEAARRPFDRLVGPPSGSHIVLHGTSGSEVALASVCGCECADA